MGRDHVTVRIGPGVPCAPAPSQYRQQLLTQLQLRALIQHVTICRPPLLAPPRGR